MSPERPRVARHPLTATTVSLPASRSTAAKLSSVRTVRTRAVRQNTSVTSHPVSSRTRSKQCTPVCSRMPPPDMDGSSSQASGDGSKR